MAIPIAAGVLFPSLGIELRPEWSALLMSVSSIIVATNAVLLKQVERSCPAVGGGCLRASFGLRRGGAAGGRAVGGRG
jgi:hypothetical protein